MSEGKNPGIIRLKDKMRLHIMVCNQGTTQHDVQYPHISIGACYTAWNQNTQQFQSKPLPNNDPIQHTMSPQCLRLQLLLGSQGTATVEGTGLVNTAGWRGGREEEKPMECWKMSFFMIAELATKQRKVNQSQIIIHLGFRHTHA